jgi:hypothetical protein
MPIAIQGRAEAARAALRSRRALIEAATRFVARTESAGVIDW